MHLKLVLLTFLALLTSHATSLAAVIPKLPYTITKPGQYQLLKSLRYTGSENAITVNCDDVTIDLRGFTIEGDAAVKVTSQTAGVAALNRKNITVRNGTIRHFFRGVYFEGEDAAGGHLVENVRVDQSALLGIQVKGQYSIVRSNRITTVESATAFSLVRYGIFVEGSGARVSGNDIQGLVPASSGSYAYGIFANASARASIDDNRVHARANLSSNAFGIYVQSSPASTVQRNQISSFYGGVFFNSSLFCKYRDNLCTDCNGNYSGGSDAGNNQ